MIRLCNDCFTGWWSGVSIKIFKTKIYQLLIVFLFYNTYNRFDHITSCENEAKVRKWALHISSYIRNLIPKHRIHLSSLFEFVLQSVYSTFANMTFLPIPRTVRTSYETGSEIPLEGCRYPNFSKPYRRKKPVPKHQILIPRKLPIIVTPDGCISKYPKITAWMYRCLPWQRNQMVIGWGWRDVVHIEKNITNEPWKETNPVVCWFC